MIKSKNVTIGDVARKAGVCRATVSIALNKAEGRFPEKTRERIIKVANEMGYVPNAGARSVRLKKFNSVGFVISKQLGRGFTPHALLMGVTDELYEHGYKLNLIHVDDKELFGSGFIPALRREIFVDGIISNHQAPEIPNEWIAQLEERKIPIVHLNTQGSTQVLRPNDFQGAYDSVKYLKALGHERIALALNIRTNHFSKDIRIDGWLKALKDFGLSESESLMDKTLVFSVEDWLEYIVKLPEKERPTAIVFDWVQNLVKFMKCSNRENKIRIPENISILSIVGEGIDIYKDTEISRFEVDWEILGRKSARLILDMINNDKASFHASEILQDFEFYPGDTVRSLI